jgi:hypothetical protein
MLTGYTTDKVSPSGQLEPPSPKDFPHIGCNIAKYRPPDVPMLPFVMMPRPLQESNVINKGGTAGFLGKAYDPYYLFPPGDDNDMNKMDRIRVDDLKIRVELSPERLTPPRQSPPAGQRKPARTRTRCRQIQSRRLLSAGVQPHRQRSGSGSV